MMKLPGKFFAAVISVSAGLFSACSSQPADVLSRAGGFVKTPAAAKAVISLELPFLTQTPLRGMYHVPAGDTVRYKLSNDTFRIDLNQSGREAWMVLENNALHLSTEDLTDTEYARLRLLLGPLGTPLLSLDDLLRMIEREYDVVSSRSDGWLGDDILVAAPRPGLRDAIRSWVSFQIGAAGHLLETIAPDTLELRVSRRDGKIMELKQLNRAGQMASRLAFDYSVPASDTIPAFQTPADMPVFGSRSLILALGVSPQWLVGKSVPAGSLQQFDGKSVPLSSFRGRPMIINFWATWCGPCQVEWPVLQELYNRHGSRVAFLLLSDEDTALVRSYLDAYRYTAPVYLLRDNNIRLGFGVNSFPSTYFVDAKGIIRGAYIGFPAYQTVEQSQAALFQKYESVLNES